VISLLVASPDAMTPNEVRAELGDDLAYTTVMTVLSRLADKRLVTRAKAGRGYVYAAIRDDAEVTARQMQRLLEEGEDRAAVLARFVGVLSPSDEALLGQLLRSGSVHS
jgi:predicted transcriptional regulator